MQKDESQISRQARWQRKHRAMGLCVLCSRPAFKGWRCKKHYEQHKITMLVVTHNMDLARQMPRKIRMADGRLIGDGVDAGPAHDAPA